MQHLGQYLQVLLQTFWYAHMLLEATVLGFYVDIEDLFLDSTHCSGTKHLNKFTGY